MTIFNQENQTVGVQLNAYSQAKFSIGQKVIYRVSTGIETFDLRCTVLDVVHSDISGYLYRLSGLKDYLASDIKPESSIRPNLTSQKI
jgi:hypothetical protein